MDTAMKELTAATMAAFDRANPQVKVENKGPIGLRFALGSTEPSPAMKLTPYPGFHALMTEDELDEEANENWREAE